MHILKNLRPLYISYGSSRSMGGSSRSEMGSAIFVAIQGPMALISPRFDMSRKMPSPLGKNVGKSKNVGKCKMLGKKLMDSLKKVDGFDKKS